MPVASTRPGGMGPPIGRISTVPSPQAAPEESLARRQSIGVSQTRRCLHHTHPRRQRQHRTCGKSEQALYTAWRRPHPPDQRAAGMSRLLTDQDPDLSFAEGVRPCGAVHLPLWILMVNVQYLSGVGWFCVNV